MAHQTERGKRNGHYHIDLRTIFVSKISQSGIKLQTSVPDNFHQKTRMRIWKLCFCISNNHYQKSNERNLKSVFFKRYCNPLVSSVPNQSMGQEEVIENGKHSVIFII
jgi:hypothetical protein